MKQGEAVVPEHLRESGEYDKLAALLPKNWQSLPEFDYTAIRWRLLAAELAGRLEHLEDMHFALAPYLHNVGKTPFALASRVLWSCAKYHYQTGDLPQALKVAALAEAAAKALEDELTEVEAVQLTGQVLFALEKYDEAMACFEQAIVLYTEQARPYRLGLAYEDLGATFNRLGRVEDAHTTLERSIKLLSKSRDEDSLAIARLVLAESLNAIGEPEKAYQYLLFALETFEKNRSKYLHQALNDLAATLILLKDFDHFGRYLNRALDLKETAEADELAATFEIRGRFHMAQKQFDAAEKDLRMAAEISGESANKSLGAKVKRTFARLQLAQKRNEAAATFLTQALELTQEIKEPLLEIELKALLAQAICEDNPVEAFKLAAEIETALEGRSLAQLQRLMQLTRKRLDALEQEHYFVLSDAKLPLLSDAREAMLKWMWARSLYKAKGSARRAASLLGVTPTYIRRLTKIIPRDLLKSKKKK
jgi:tetratricopeptide (TPR) repeat protein